MEGGPSQGVSRLFLFAPYYMRDNAAELAMLLALGLFAFAFYALTAGGRRLRQRPPWLLRWVVGRWLARGRVPQHVAFIMDGNRRWARDIGREPLKGHRQGYATMLDVLEHCGEFGVSTASVYAFSIENFKRSADEVNGLMRLATDKFDEACEQKGGLHRNGVRVRVLGDVSLLTPDVRRAVERVQRSTARNPGATLNICLAYTSQQEIEAAAQCSVAGVAEGQLIESDITAGLLGRCMYTDDQPPVDLLVRTSGETRLSDFMLWQTSHAHLEFTQTLWPDFTWWNLLRILLRWRGHAPELAARLARDATLRAARQREADAARVGRGAEGGELEQRLALAERERGERCEKFVHEVRARRQAELVDTTSQ